MKRSCSSCKCFQQYCGEGETCIDLREHKFSEGAHCVPNEIAARVYKHLYGNNNVYNNNNDVTDNNNEQVNVQPVNQAQSRIAASGVNAAKESGQSDTKYKCSVIGSSKCSNKGYCQNDGTCKCTWHYTGSQCDIKLTNPLPPCVTNPCKAGKRCTNYDIGRGCF
ncbi:uncharacterized protein [Amphiura filiformis]|uniref:uncharacterized protein n=1 Tax=Amphiura filiformis TaxID=82378 RepID=UPI003B211A81